MDGSGDLSFSPLPGIFPVQAGSQPSQNPETSPDLPNKSIFVPDCKQPIVINWPPLKPNQSDVSKGRNSNKIGSEALTTPMTNSSYNPMMTNGGMNQLDAQSPSNNYPPVANKTREIKIPEFKCPIRGPQRSWTQCVENVLITDQVRRPMARICHKRPMPPLLIPYAKFEEMKAKATEKDRKQVELEQRRLEREALRLRSRERQSKWNYTVESLLERKKQKEKEAEVADFEDTSHLMEEVVVEKETESNVQLNRAKKLMLYRKGLIRDFHSALGYSKMMQEIDQIKAQSNQQGDESGSGSMQKKCMKLMMQANKTSGEKRESTPPSAKPTPKPIPTDDKPAFAIKVMKRRPINPKIKAQSKKTEIRGKELQEEMNKELNHLQELFVNYTRGLPEEQQLKEQELKEEQELKIGLLEKKPGSKCSKPIPMEPVCDGKEKERRREKYRIELYNDIKDRLATDAYIESHEKEIDRQACEFIAYKRQTEAIQKAKEKQMIEEKVEYHRNKSEAAALVLIEFRKEKEARANVYDALKEKWEAEWKEKEKVKKTGCQKVLDKVITDFEERKINEVTKRCELDPARQWAREQLVAGENFERECERSSERRKKAEDIAMFNKCQVLEKKHREDYKKYMDDVWAMKAKQEYFDEMKEMKSYAHECIKEWEAKGRSSFPMLHAMKKWDYDSGMYPYLFADGNVNRHQTKTVANAARQNNCPALETTSKRLGFNSGGS